VVVREEGNGLVFAPRIEKVYAVEKVRADLGPLFARGLFLVRSQGLALVETGRADY
jgi:hypothetical protein